MRHGDKEAPGRLLIGTSIGPPLRGIALQGPISQSVVSITMCIPVLWTGICIVEGRTGRQSASGIVPPRVRSMDRGGWSRALRAIEDPDVATY